MMSASLGPGSIGGELLTAILDHRRDLEVVGVRVYSDTKNGVDAGTLVGRDPIGVAATTVDEARGYAARGFTFIALPSDAVLLTQAYATFLEGIRA
jgi:hypothetical protein